ANSEFFGFTFRREVGLSGELDEGHCWIFENWPSLLGWAGEDTCPCVVSFWLQRLRDHDLALEILHHAFIEPHFRGTLRQRHLVNLVLQLKQRVKQILRTRRASDHINVCGHDLVNSLQHSISIKGATYG